MKPIHIILTTLFSLFVVCGLLAQDKYEYATHQTIDNMVLWTDNKAEKFEFKKEENWFSQTLPKLNALSIQVWEVYDITEVLLNRKG
jgi:hypothetical protein